MKLIDADALVKNVFKNAISYNAFVNLVKRQPTIKAVEVVRCKDCKWYEIYQLKADGTDDRRYKPSYCTLFRHRFKPDWFCADGERKGEEG